MLSGKRSFLRTQGIIQDVYKRQTEKCGSGIDLIIVTTIIHLAIYEKRIFI